MGESKQYIRAFAAPGTAFLLRKLAKKELRSALEYMLNSVSTFGENNMEYVEGISLSLFESVKGPGHSYHSKTREIVQIIMEIVGALPLNKGNIYFKYLFHVKRKVLKAQ